MIATLASTPKRFRRRDGGRHGIQSAARTLGGRLEQRAVEVRFPQTAREALSIVRDTANNLVFERMFQRVLESIREGDTIADPMRRARLVDAMVVNMIEVGEETGDLDTMLYKIADFYDEEVDNTVKALISLLEPIMIVFLGGAIGGIVISLFLPLVKLLEGLSK